MSERTFDPQVVALLQEVAKDSGSTFLRLPKQPMLQWVGRPEEVISPQGSHLSKVEKHLVQAYREEAAWVLEQACIAQLKKLPLVFSSSNSDPKLLRSSATRVNKREGAGPQGHQEIALIAGGKPVDAARLAMLSLRVSPNDVRRNVLAIAFERCGQQAVSMQVLRRLLAGEPASVQRAQAFENMAQLWATKGDYVRSFECSANAARADESKIRFLAWCFTTSLQAGDETKARTYSLKVERHPSIGALDVVARSLVDGRNKKQWEPTAPSRLLAARLQSEVAESVGEICDAFR